MIKDISMLKTIACLSLLILVGCSEDSSTTPAPSGVSLQLSPTSDAEVLSVVLRNNSTVDLWLDSRGFFWTSIYDKQGTSLVTPPPPPPPSASIPNIEDGDPRDAVPKSAPAPPAPMSAG